MMYPSVGHLDLVQRPIINSLLLLSLFFSFTVFASTDTTNTTSTQEIQSIKIIPSSKLDFRSHEYYSSLLKLALDKTANEYAEAKLVETEGKMMQDRAFNGLNSKSTIDVFWSVTSASREAQSIPIRVPLLEGIMGYRVSLIRKLDTHKFVNATELRKLIAGQGHDWPDLEILSANGYLVWGASDYDSLIDLLRKKRIDYFPRAINEVVTEYNYHQDPNLVIESQWLLHYPSFMFFFVSQNNPELAKRIERGLKLAKADGSFNDLFEQYIDLAILNATLDLSNRAVLTLQNPFHSIKTRQLSECFRYEGPIAALIDERAPLSEAACAYLK